MTNTTKLLALVGLASLAPLASCNDPLHVSIPDIVQPGQLTDSAALATVRAGVLGDFGIAYTGDHPDGSGATGASEGVIMYGGLLADEWINSETFPTRIEVDARTIQETNADVDLWFRRMHQARTSAEKAAAQYSRFAFPHSDPNRAEMLTLAGMTYVFIVWQHFWARSARGHTPVPRGRSATSSGRRKSTRVDRVGRRAGMDRSRAIRS